MKTCGIICELNPAHNGHKYIFDMARKVTDADYIIAIMSGDFVQRGEPAIINKHVRTKMALLLGADVVIELPGIFSTGSAQYFARGAVSILNQLNTDYLVFGSESADMNILRSDNCTSPNDILGSEYIKAIDYFKSDIKPIPVKRIGTDYNDTDKVVDNIASASYIREHFEENLSQVIPFDIYPLFLSYSETACFLELNDFSSNMIYKLLLEKSVGYSRFFDVYADFSDKIIKHIYEFTNYHDFCFKLKSKEIAFSHIKRGLLHILLNITEEDINYSKNNNYISYIRLLGFNSSNPGIFSVLEQKKNKDIKIISKLSDAKEILSKENYSIFMKDIEASNLYNYICNSKSGNPQIYNEMSRAITKI